MQFADHRIDHVFGTTKELLSLCQQVCSSTDSCTSSSIASTASSRARPFCAHTLSSERGDLQMPPGDMRRAELPAAHQPREHRDTQEDFDRLCAAVNNLHVSGWYHGAMTYTEAKRKLRHSNPGTFLVRDSSDPN